MNDKDPKRSLLDDEAARLFGIGIAQGLTGIPSEPSIVPMMMSQANDAILFRSDKLKTSRLHSQPDATERVETLLEQLNPRVPPPAPERKTIKGTFFGCTLLNRGWWTYAPGNRGLASGNWRGASRNSDINSVRHWLNKGWELWAPSWSLWNPDDTTECLFGQIGHGDESYSIPVVIAPTAAANLWSKMATERWLARGVIARGKLCHDSHTNDHLSEAVRKAINNLRAKRSTTLGVASSEEKSNVSGFYFVVDEFTRHGVSDFIEFDGDQPDVYSAYIWACLARADQLSDIGVLSHDDVIFVWQHTNILDRASLEYHYAALLFQRDYLERLSGRKLRILQHSFSLENVLNDSSLEKPALTQADLTNILRATREALASDNILSFPKKLQQSK